MKPDEIKRPAVFYGWWIVVAITLVTAYISGVIFYGFTAAFQPIADEFAWSYTQISLAASIRGLEAGLITPLVGFLFDRWGPRRWLFAGVAITSLGLFLLGRVNSLAMFYGVSILIGIGIVTCTGMIIVSVIGNWFRKRASLATAIALSGGFLGGVFVPLVTRLIDTYVWRHAMMILSLSALVICLPLTLVVRHRPEPFGYLPDGGMGSDLLAGASEPPKTAGPDAGIKEALKSRGFWHVALSMTCHMTVSNGILTHVMPYLASIGMTRSAASLIAMAVPLLSIATQLSSGWLGDKFDKRRIGTVTLTSLAASMVLFIYAGAGLWMIAPFLVLYCIGFGGFIPMVPGLQMGYFGRARLGTILGLTSGVGLIGAIIGPPLAGWIFDVYGSYRYAWLAMIVVSLMGVVAMMTAPALEKVPPLTRKLKYGRTS